MAKNSVAPGRKCVRCVAQTFALGRNLVQRVVGTFAPGRNPVRCMAQTFAPGRKLARCVALTFARWRRMYLKRLMHGPSLLPSDKSDGNSNQMGGFKLFDDALQFVEETVARLFAGLADEIRLGHEHFLKLTNAFTKLGIGSR